MKFRTGHSGCVRTAFIVYLSNDPIALSGKWEQCASIQNFQGQRKAFVSLSHLKFFCDLKMFDSAHNSDIPMQQVNGTHSCVYVYEREFDALCVRSLSHDSCGTSIDLHKMQQRMLSSRSLASCDAYDAHNAHRHSHRVNDQHTFSACEWWRFFLLLFFISIHSNFSIRTHTHTHERWTNEWIIFILLVKLRYRIGTVANQA